MSLTIGNSNDNFIVPKLRALHLYAVYIYNKVALSVLRSPSRKEKTNARGILWWLISI